MKRIIRLTESDLTRIVRRVIKEQSSTQLYKNGETYINNKPSRLFKINSFNGETKEYSVDFSGYDGGGNFDTIEDATFSETKLTDLFTRDGYKKITQQEYDMYLKVLPTKPAPSK
jgi:hypothetical protein